MPRITGFGGKADPWNDLIYDHTTPMSFGELIKWMIGDYVHLYEHFEAIGVSDLKIPYTTTIVGGGSVSMFVDDLPSAIRLQTGASDGDSAYIESDRTFSLLALGGSKLVFEVRAKISTETNINMILAYRNETTNIDRVSVQLRTAIPAINTGGISSVVASASHYTETNITGLFDMTQYHTYRLEYIPSTSIELFIDDVSQGSEAVGANVPPDQAYKVYLRVVTEENVNKILDVDYYKAWSE